MKSGIDSLMNIYYCIEPEETAVSRIKHANYIFIANNTYLNDRYGSILPIYRVGRRSYGM